MQTQPPRWSYQTKLVVSLVLLALAVYLLSRFSAVIPPFILALILAYILTPFVNLLHRRLRLPRLLAIFLSYLLPLALVLALSAVILPILASQFQALNLDVQRLIDQIETLAGNRYALFGYPLNARPLLEQALGALQGFLEPVVGQTLELLVGVVSSLVWVIFIFIVSFYLIKDGEKLHAWVEDHVPPSLRQDYLLLRDEINTIWSAFFRGQLLLGLVVAAIFTTLGFILGLPFALAMGLLAGILEFLPSIGHGIWMTMAALLALFLGSTWLPLPNWAFALLIIALHLFFQQFDLNYLIPRIIGRSVRLPPLVVILGIVAGALSAGIIGIPLAAPTIASARVIGRYIYANLFDLEPFPQSATHALPPPNPRWWKQARPKNAQEVKQP